MQESKQYKVFKVFNVLIMLIVVLVMLYPFLYVLAQSFSSEKYIMKGMVTFYPRGFTTETYNVIMHEKDFWVEYKNTIIYTVLSTAISMFLTGTMAYALSKKRLIGRNFFLVFALFTMFFGGGIIPNYVIVKGLGMRNTIWAVIIPGAISTYNMIVMKTFFDGLPIELEEAAEVDGLDTYGILCRIVLPLSKPIIATIALFYAVAAWNNWFGPFMYLDDKELFPVTLYIRNIIAGAQTTAANSGSNTEALAQVADTIKSASIILTVLPILCVYPFVQKYFVKGVLIGSVKG